MDLCSQPRSSIHSGNPPTPLDLSVHVCKVKKPFIVCVHMCLFFRQLARHVPGLSAQLPPRKTIQVTPKEATRCPAHPPQAGGCLSLIPAPLPSLSQALTSCRPPTTRDWKPLLKLPSLGRDLKQYASWQQMPIQGGEEPGEDTRECPCGFKGHPAAGWETGHDTMAGLQGTQLSGGLSSRVSPEPVFWGYRPILGRK